MGIQYLIEIHTENLIRTTMTPFILFVLYVVFTLVVLSNGWKAIVWESGTAVYLLVATFIVGLPWFTGLILWVVILAIEAFVRVEPLRDEDRG